MHDIAVLSRYVGTRGSELFCNVLAHDGNLLKIAVDGLGANEVFAPLRSGVMMLFEGPGLRSRPVLVEYTRDGASVLVENVYPILSSTIDKMVKLAKEASCA